jgi:hypothetical protein
MSESNTQFSKKTRNLSNEATPKMQRLSSDHMNMFMKNGQQPNCQDFDQNQISVQGGQSKVNSFINL